MRLHNTLSFAFLLLSFALTEVETRAATEIPFQQSGSTLSVTFSGGPLQLVLEGRSGNGWKPLAVQYGTAPNQPFSNPATSRKDRFVAPKPGQVGLATFAMPRGYTRAQLRVMSSPAKFPVARLKGPKDFTGTSTPAIPAMSSPVTMSLGVSAAAVRDASLDSDVAVTESDIWKVVGNQLFFFNQYRGLQIFDISNPANPIRTGSLRLPASGEQFYVLNANASRLALIAREASSDGLFQGNSAVFIFSVEAGVPSLIRKLPLQGDSVDSRLIGSRLYVATFQSPYAYNVSPGGSSPSPIVLQGFDLANPESPTTYTPLNLQGNWPALLGTSGTLLISANSTEDWSRSTVHVINISGSSGQPSFVKSLSIKGSVADKFKMHVANGTVSVVSNSWNWSEGWNQRKTWVETFPATGDNTAPLAQLELEEARGESLHATRFDGDKLYVVTFRNIDPLFVVDLSDPTAPVVKGHLEVPGWSTYIEPYGDRLLAVGVEDFKVTVSLFDVSDPAAPALLSRVPLGTGSSWSEANYDEKAVGFFPDRGVVLVPYQTWGAGGMQSATAVLKVNPSVITYESSILHEFTARRAAFAGNNILSISGQELIVEDAQNLNALTRVSQLSLAWQVDRVVPFGGAHLIQIEDGEDNAGFWGWRALSIWAPSQNQKTMLRISKASSPDDLIEEIEMGPGRVIGAVTANGRLYVGQFVRGSNGAADVIRTWIFDASAPPALQEISHVDTAISGVSARLNLDSAQALWPNASTLVWHLPTYAYFYDGPIDYVVPMVASPAPIAATAAPVTLQVSSSVRIAPWSSQSSDIASVLCPVTVSNPQAPVALPVISIRGANGASVRSNRGMAFASGGFVFTSFQEDSASQARANSVPQRISRSWLQVIDFRPAGPPVLRDRVSIPGELVAATDVDAQGALLLTVDPNGSSFRACAYDGISAYQMDVWTGNVQGATFAADTAGRIFLAKTWDRPDVTSLGFDSVSGRFRVAGTTTVPHPISDLSARDGLLLAGSWSKVSAFPIKPNGTLKPPLTLTTASNLWIQISQASIVPGTGAWFPAGAYGVEFLSIPAQ